MSDEEEAIERMKRLLDHAATGAYAVKVGEGDFEYRFVNADVREAITLTGAFLHILIDDTDLDMGQAIGGVVSAAIRIDNDADWVKVEDESGGGDDP